MTPVRHSPYNKMKALYRADINRFYAGISFILEQNGYGQCNTTVGQS